MLPHMPAPTISATVITYNEEDNIRDCLESVKWVDELIVVDSFSSDRTVDICRQYTRHVVQQPWPGHVRQKQFALEQATGDWILSLDADERLSSEAQEEILSETSRAADHIDGFVFPRHSYYLGRWINHGGWYPDYKLRLIRRGKGAWTGVDPHDKLCVEGATKILKTEILHYVYRNLSHQLMTIDTFSAITARQWQEQGEPFRLRSLLLRPPAKFVECYIWKKGFLDGVPGFIIAVASSFYVFLKYAKLWEARQCRPDA
jgi:glycosyltransferase involved in cell wall biosynthesis